MRLRLFVLMAAGCFALSGCGGSGGGGGHEAEADPQEDVKPWDGMALESLAGKMFKCSAVSADRRTIVYLTITFNDAGGGNCEMIVEAADDYRSTGEYTGMLTSAGLYEPISGTNRARMRVELSPQSPLLIMEIIFDSYNNGKGGSFDFAHGRVSPATLTLKESGRSIELLGAFSVLRRP